MAKCINGPEGVALWLDQDEAEKLRKLIGNYTSTGLLASLWQSLCDAGVEETEEQFYNQGGEDDPVIGIAL